MTDQLGPAAPCEHEDLAGLVDHPLAHLDAADPAIRRLAVAASSGLLEETSVAERITAMLHSDPHPGVRAEAAEALGHAGSTVLADLVGAVDDPDARVVEAAVTALGEIAAPAAVGLLSDIARGHQDTLVREAAVAALGAIADDRAVPVLLELVDGAPPQVRRRAVVALTVFDDPAVEAALRRAASDRNPMVREVAQQVVGTQHAG